MSDTGWSHDGTEHSGTTTTLTNGSEESLDAVFEMLAARRRRYVLYYLNDRPEKDTTVCELVNLVAAWERMVGTDPPALHRRRVSASLRNDHLPALRDAGLVEYGGETVSYRVDGDFFHRLLSCAAITELP